MTPQILEFLRFEVRTQTGRFLQSDAIFRSPCLRRVTVTSRKPTSKRTFGFLSNPFSAGADPGRFTLLIRLEFFLLNLFVYGNDRKDCEQANDQKVGAGKPWTRLLNAYAGGAARFEPEVKI